MYRERIYVVLAWLLTLATNVVAADVVMTVNADSLNMVAEGLPDSLRCKMYNDLCWTYRHTFPETALLFGKKALESAERIGDYNEEAKACSFCGICNRNMANYDAAFTYYKRGLDVATRHGLRDQEAYSHVDIGNLYLYHADYAHAESELKSAVRIATEIGDHEILSFCYLNLGRVALKIGKYNNSRAYLTKALDLRQKHNMEYSGIAVVKKYLGDLSMATQDYTTALKYYTEAVDKRSGLRDVGLIAGICENVAHCYMATEKYDSAKIFADRYLNLSYQLDIGNNINRAHRILGDICVKQGLLDKALEYYDVVLAYSDTILAKETTARLTNMEYKFDKLLKEKEIDLLKKDEELRRTHLYSGLIFVVLLMTLVGVLVWRNVQSNRMNNILREQKREIEDRNEEILQQRDMLEKQNVSLERQRTLLISQKKEITDSIAYAKRIQYALLPSEAFLQKYFADGFIYYRPRDVVSGDFYWMFNDDDYFGLVVADCTGHGVPGAFMSMLGVTSLNDIVIRDGIRDTGVAMNRLRDDLKELLHQDIEDEDTPHDGMDAALMIVDKKNNVLSYSGAFISLLCIRGDEEIALKATHNPIGVYVHEVPFETHTLQLQKGDKIYLSSDGYPSQFGGPEGKKLKPSGYKNIIRKYSGLGMHEQCTKIDTALNEWRADNEQTDDVLVIGVEV